MAKEWGTKILTLEELMVELRKLKPLPPKMKNRKHYEGRIAKGKVLAGNLCITANWLCPKGDHYIQV